MYVWWFRREDGDDIKNDPTLPSTLSRTRKELLLIGGLIDSLIVYLVFVYIYTKLKVTGHSKIKFFCRVSPISTRFFLLYMYLARVSCYLDLEFHNLSLC